MSHIMTPESRHIAGYDYDDKSHVLVVVFRRLNAKYAFYDVPELIIANLAKASSKSRFFSLHIKNKFKHKKMI